MIEIVIPESAHYAQTQGQLGFYGYEKAEYIKRNPCVSC
jgi:hypothetical protein